jgi:adenylate cyclase
MLRRLLAGLRYRTVAGLLIGFVAFAGVLGSRFAGWLETWELEVFDLVLRSVPTLPGEPPLLMVWIREEEIAEFGHPLPDELLARAIEVLDEAGPRAIGVDLFRDRAGAASLAAVVVGNPRVVMVEKVADERSPGVARPPFLPDRAQVGAADLVPDPDRVVRRALLYLRDRDESVRSFALQLALRYLGEEGIREMPDPDQPDQLRLGETTIPWFDGNLGGYRDADAGGYQFLLDHRRSHRALRSVPLRDVLAGSLDPAQVRDRIAIIGTRSPSVKDDFGTPRSVGTEEGELVYGAEVHALAADQLLRHALDGAPPLGSPSESVEALWILIWCLLGGAIGTHVRSPLGLTGAVAVGSVLLVGGASLALRQALWIPVLPSGAGSLGALALGVAYVTQLERTEKAQAVRLFGKYVSRRVVDEIWSQRELFMEGGRPRPERITVTVLMSDLSGYTAAAESLDPAAVMDWIGAYMDAMARLVEEHGGIVNDFLGDGLMATFGVPLARTREEEIDRDARGAVECALAMARELDRLNESWRAEGSRTARMRVGILTGPAIVGSMGSAERLKYATVGDTVNTAARLESHDKASFAAEPETSFRILVGEATFRRLGDRFRSEALGPRALPGRDEPVTIYRILGPKGRTSSS